MHPLPLLTSFTPYHSHSPDSFIGQVVLPHTSKAGVSCYRMRSPVNLSQHLSATQVTQEIGFELKSSEQLPL
ncbi:hypothetical protein M8J76_010704 [Diaphorina citri]|nr:hypothetical protein M8J76_010704 [Diaphorina citri]